MDATSQRWIASLANYTFGLHYKCGKSNIEADALSRIPHNIERKEVEANSESVKAMINAMQLGDFSELNENPNLLVCKSACPASRKFSNEQWIKEQQDDECIAKLIEILKGRKVVKGNIYDDVRTMLKKKGRFVF